MTRELRIAILIFLIYLIYGLSSLFSLGDFVTPYFLNPLVFFLVSVAFLVLNHKENGRFFLFIAVLVQLLGVLVDVVLVELITQRMESNALVNFVNSKSFIYTSFYFYYGGLFLLVIPFHRVLKHLGKTSLLVLLVIASAGAILSTYHFASSILLMSFYLLYFLFVQFYKHEIPSYLQAVAALFVLIFLLDPFKYLV